MTKGAITIAIFESHEDAERAVHSLSDAGIDLRKISIVGRDFQSEEHAVGFYKLGDRMRFFGGLGAFWGTLAGILLGAFVMVIPVFGHLIILGPLAATIVSGAEGAAVGGAAGALVGALNGLGVPRESAIRYELAVEADKFLVTVQGSNQDVALAQEVLGAASPATVETHGLLEEATS
jgi:hypothetical protein